MLSKDETMTITYRRDLYKLLEYYSLPKVAAEIGVAEGYFSRNMLEWDLDLLYCVDNWGHIPDVKGDGNQPEIWHSKNEAAALKRVQPWIDQNKCVVLKGLSRHMAKRVPDRVLGLLYLDGNHSFEGVTEDLQIWYDKVVPGGIVAGHDFLNDAYGVQDAVFTFSARIGETVHLINENKPEDAGFWFRKKE